MLQNNCYKNKLSFFQTSNVPEDVSITILKALIPLGSHILSPALEGAGFTELMEVMTMLADAGTGKGHSHLFPAAAQWVESCVKYVQNCDISEKLASTPDLLKNNTALSAASCILDYLTDVILSITEQPPRYHCFICKSPNVLVFVYFTGLCHLSGSTKVL